MINKRNFLKSLSSAIFGTLIIGNGSNVWMMEPKKSFNEIKNAFQITSAAISLDKMRIEQRYVRNIKKAIKNRITNNIYQSGWQSTVDEFSMAVAHKIVSSNTVIYKAKIKRIADEASALILKFINDYDAMISKFST